MSSRYTVVNSSPAYIMSITCWNRPGDTFNPKRRRFNLKSPLCVLFIYFYFQISVKQIHLRLEKISSGEDNEYVLSLKQSFNPIEKFVYTQIF